MMPKPTKKETLVEEIIISKIYNVREQKIMLDRDMAELYGVKAIRLREQIKRNKECFPNHFMFRLTGKEVEAMVSQNATPVLIFSGVTFIKCSWSEDQPMELTFKRKT